MLNLGLSLNKISKSLSTFSPKNISNLQLWYDSDDVGMQGYSLNFDGTDDYLRAENEIVGYPFTFEAWVKFDDVAIGSRSIMAINDSTNTFVYYTIDLNADKLRITARNPTILASTTGTTTIVPNTWYHVAGVFESATDRRLYVNGVLEASNTSSVIFTNVITNQVLLGTFRTENMTFFLNGKLSDVRIWNTARSQTDIINNFINRLFGNEAGLVGYWKLDDGRLTTAKDYTTNNNGAVFFGGNWVLGDPFSTETISDLTPMKTWKDKSNNGFHANQTATANRPTYRTNQVNGKPAVKFDGADDYLQISESANDISRNISGATIFVVKKITGIGTTATSFSVDNGTTTGLSRMTLVKSFTNVGAVQGRRLDSEAQSTALGTTALSTTIPVVLCATFDYAISKNMTLFKNGLNERTILLSSSIAGNTENTAPINGMVLGGSVGATIGVFMQGDIYEFLFFDTLLDSEQIANIDKYLKSKWGIT